MDDPHPGSASGALLAPLDALPAVRERYDPFLPHGLDGMEAVSKPPRLLARPDDVREFAAGLQKLGADGGPARSLDGEALRRLERHAGPATSASSTT